MQSIAHQELKAKQRSLRAEFPETMGLKVHRALSWLERAEMAQDDDARFLFLWIGFNAAYAKEADFHASVAQYAGERTTFKEYFERLVDLDCDKRIFNAIWTRFNGPIRVLMSNKYIFNPFWQHHNGVDGYGDWLERFKSSGHGFSTAVSTQDTARILSYIFDRLYVLRNQLMHGGATWNSSANRDQVRDSAAILSFLIPVFLDLMMDHPLEDWGVPFYPVVE